MTRDAVIITVGTELTGGRVLDTNSSWLAKSLGEKGVRVAYALTASDSAEQIGALIKFALNQEPSIIIIAGGLGSTHDDITAAAICSALDLPLEVNVEAAAMVASATGADNAGELSSFLAQQANLPMGSKPLPPVGTAPGFIIDINQVLIAALPGVPSELKEMWSNATDLPEINQLIGSSARRRLTLCLYGTNEMNVSSVTASALEKAGADLNDSGIEISLCSLFGEITLDVNFSEKERRQAEQFKKEAATMLSEYLYSEGESIAEVIGRELLSRGLTMATGESCTGGLLGGEITAISGSSEYYLGGAIAYSNQVKKALLRVRQQTLDMVGAVSEAVAQQLAMGARSATGADYGIGITGVAGPDGGTPEKPVGLVFICVSSEHGDLVKGFNFPGDRENIRRASVISSLHILREKIVTDCPISTT